MSGQAGTRALDFGGGGGGRRVRAAAAAAELPLANASVSSSSLMNRCAQNATAVARFRASVRERKWVELCEYAAIGFVGGESIGGGGNASSCFCVLGDSYAAQLTALLDPVGVHFGFAFRVLPFTPVYDERWRHEPCATDRRPLSRHLAECTAVVLYSHWAAHTPAGFASLLRCVVESALARQTRVVLFGALPRFRRFVDDCSLGERLCDPGTERSDQEGAWNDRLRAVVRRQPQRLMYGDLTPYMCDANGTCSALHRSTRTPLLLNPNHLTQQGARLFAADMIREGLPEWVRFLITTNTTT